ncbi:MAG: winged helix-turn-helix domain-containing protein, partial [Methanobrevibacter sp.]|nr:winged helix-turn-helix domain-containing protein [Methanobrevibacter sp.]
MLEKIFGSKNRVKILQVILNNIETTFSTIELSKNVKISYGTVRRELINLEEANLITFQKEGCEKKYRVNPESPILNNLKKI